VILIENWMQQAWKLWSIRLAMLQGAGDARQHAQLIISADHKEARA